MNKYIKFFRQHIVFTTILSDIIGLMAGYLTIYYIFGERNDTKTFFILISATIVIEGILLLKKITNKK